jgi:hypothetical protein
VRHVLQPPDILRRPEHRVDHVNLFLANVFFFFALLPFLSPLPSESDVQLPAFIIAFIIVARDVLKGRFTLNWVDGVFLSIAIWSFAFVLPWNPFFVRQRVGVGAAFLVYYVVKKYSARFSTRVLMVVVSITLVSTLVQLIFPSVYETVASLLVRTVKNLGQGGRGASGPSAEPSFLAGMALVHGLLIIYYYAIARIQTPRYLIGLGMSATSLMLSKSATGFMFLGILVVIGGVYYLFRGMTVGRWVMLLASTATLAAVIVGPLAQSRGGLILVGLYQRPKDVLRDGSAQERVRSLAIGVLSCMKYPLGVGGGGFANVAVEMNQDYHLDRVFEEARSSNLSEPVNAGGMYFAELGIVFAFFLAIVVGASMKIEVFHLMFCMLALLFLLFSFSITLPLAWILLGMAARKDFLVSRPTMIRRAA